MQEAGRGRTVHRCDDAGMDPTSEDRALEAQTCRSPLPRAPGVVARSRAEMPRRWKVKASTMLQSLAQTEALGGTQKI